MSKNEYLDIYKVGPDLDRLERHRSKYIRYFTDCKKVLDIGCGRGVFLALLKKHGIDGEGVDKEKEMVSICNKKGFLAFHNNAVSFLENKQVEYDGIFCGHIIEHLYPKDALRLIELCYTSLKKNGKLVILTPNIEDINIVTGGFWMDLSHIRPYPLLLLEKLLSHFGFRIIEKGEDKDTELRFNPLWKRFVKSSLNIIRKRLFGNFWYRGDIFIVGEKIQIIRRLVRE